MAVIIYQKCDLSAVYLSKKGLVFLKILRSNFIYPLAYMRTNAAKVRLDFLNTSSATLLLW
jgi:hypothetical protein